LIGLSSITHEIKPTIWSNPDYDSHNAYSEVFFSMESLLGKLDSFLKEYSYIMPQDIITYVSDIMFQCNDKHWGSSLAGGPEYEPTKTELEAAEVLLNSLQLAVDSFKSSLGVINE
jgi:hypothetical protein